MTDTSNGEATDQFQTPFHYLTAWFRVLGPIRTENESPAALDEIPPFDDRQDLIRGLDQVTQDSLAAGVRLPFEAFVRENGLDLIDRLVLLTLLRAAHDPQSPGGLRLIQVLRALGSSDFGRQVEVRRKLDEEGPLRDLGLVECAPIPDLTQRLYRLPRRLVDYLTTGDGDTLGLPAVPRNPQEALDRLEYDSRRVVDAIQMPSHDTDQMWQGVRKGHPGWDHTALRRDRLSARLEASYRQETCRIGAELRRLDLNGDERLAWALLFLDSSAEEVGLALPMVLAFAGWQDDAQAAADRAAQEALDAAARREQESKDREAQAIADKDAAEARRIQEQKDAELRQAAAVEVVDPDFETRFDEVGRHGVAHIAHADE